jgi:hypothetical protein
MIVLNLKDYITFLMVMKATVFLTLLFTVATCIGCTTDIYNVEVEGKVFDQELLPVSNVVVEVECWYYGNSPDQSYVGSQIKQIETDKNGRYKLSFVKGAFLEITVKAKGYKDQFLGEYVNSSKLEIDINLN